MGYELDVRRIALAIRRARTNAFRRGGVQCTIATFNGWNVICVCDFFQPNFFVSMIDLF